MIPSPSPYDTNLRDRAFCDSKDLTGAEFCRQDVFEKRLSGMTEYKTALSRCDWGVRAHSRPISDETIKNEGYGIYGKAQRTEPFGYESKFTLQESLPGPSRGEIQHHVQTTLEQCKVGAPNSFTWTIERLGPFVSNGGGMLDWHTFGWPDSGGFRSELLKGDVWLQAAIFSPSDKSGNIFGMPPLHVHHMHITSGQSQGLYRLEHRLAFKNSEGQTGAEVDIHGDRQCQDQLGGVICLARSYPEGFGMKLLEQMENFGDINDVRPLGSSPLAFFAQHAFKWTRSAQHPVGQFSALVGLSRDLLLGLSTADDFLLHFDPRFEKMSQYMMWGELEAPASVRLVHLYWHSHHKFTVDQWAFSSHASTLGLDTGPYTLGDLRKAMNLTAANLTIDLAMQHILDSVDERQRFCLVNSCPSSPQLRCQMTLDRWDNMPDGTLQERYHAPHCQSWSLRAGDPITIVSFHEPMIIVKEGIFVWMHSLLYGIYVQETPTETIPHVLHALPYGMLNLALKPLPR